MPEPVLVPTEGIALGARYHAQVAFLYAIETSMVEEGAIPDEVEVTLLEPGK
jgi:propanediol dehydratase large subunit